MRLRGSLAVAALPLLLATAACAPSSDGSSTATDTEGASPSAQQCDTDSLPLKTSGQLTVGTDSPAYEPWFVDNDPTNGKGYESAVAYAVAEQLGFTDDQVTWVKVPFNTSYAPGDKDFDFDINQISIDAQRAKAVDFSDGYYQAAQAVIALKGTDGAEATSLDDLKGLRLGAQTGTTSLTAIRDIIQPDEDPSVFEDTNAAKQALQNDQVDAILADLPTAFYISAVEIPDSVLIGQFQPETGEQEEFGMLFQKGSELVPCVNEALAALRDDGTLDQIEQQWLSDVVDVPTLQWSDWSPSSHELERRRVRRRLRSRSIVVATTMTVVVFVGLGLVITSSPGWPTVQDYFFNWDYAKDAFPSIWKGFWINVQLFLIAEPLILVLGLAVALARSARSAWLVPIRVLAVIYTDLLRGIPTILLIVLLGFGMPALGLQGIPNSRFFWAAIGLVLSYGAYVAEVFRSGIESIHPSQVASAEALGLSRGQTMRFVVVPQAVRRVVPPLLNDFVSLQKDTALVLAVGLFDAVFAAKDYANYNFNYTPLVVVAGLFVAITIPLARLCDWLQRRMVEKERAGAR